MTITVSKNPSSNTELLEALKQAFPRYSSKFFGLEDETIILAKSLFVGVQISHEKSGINVQAAPPTLLAGVLVFIFSIAGFAYSGNAYKNFEREVASVLFKRFN